MRILVLLLLGACAAQPAPPSAAVVHASLLPGSIGVLVQREAAGIVVSAVKQDSAAARAGVRAGDVVLRYNGAAVADLREFNRRVIDSPPGSTARVELLRDGAVHRVEVPVRELDTTPRV
jgi:S1-C subfamily serine protease